MPRYVAPLHGRAGHILTYYSTVCEWTTQCDVPSSQTVADVLSSSVLAEKLHMFASHTLQRALSTSALQNVWALFHINSNLWLCPADWRWTNGSLHQFLSCSSFLATQLRFISRNTVHFHIMRRASWLPQHESSLDCQLPTSRGLQFRHLLLLLSLRQFSKFVKEMLFVANSRFLPACSA